MMGCTEYILQDWILATGLFPLLFSPWLLPYLHHNYHHETLEQGMVTDDHLWPLADLFPFAPSSLRMRSKRKIQSMRLAGSCGRLQAIKRNNEKKKDRNDSHSTSTDLGSHAKSKNNKFGHAYRQTGP